MYTLIFSIQSRLKSFISSADDFQEMFTSLVIPTGVFSDRVHLFQVLLLQYEVRALVIAPHKRTVFNTVYMYVFLPANLPIRNRKHFNDAFIRKHALDL